MIDQYDDIINLPRHISKKRSPMPIEDRAAQFSPFAALTGHDSAVKETARTTDRKIELDIYMRDNLDYKLQILVAKINEEPRVSITYFEPDDKKVGGIYTTLTNTIKKIDIYNKTILMEGDIIIPIDEIINIEIIDIKDGGI